VPKEKIQSETRVVEQGYGFPAAFGPAYGYGFGYPPTPRFREDFAGYAAFGRGLTGLARGYGYEDVAATDQYWGQTDTGLVGATDESAYGAGRGIALTRGLGRGRGLATAYPDTGAYGTTTGSFGYGAVARNTKAADRAFHPYR